MKVKGTDFMNRLKRDRKKFTKLLNPRIDYSKEYDMFSMVWGDKGIIDSTIELNLLNEGDLRLDLTEEGLITGIEIDNFSDVLSKFNCDKNDILSHPKGWSI